MAKEAKKKSPVQKKLMARLIGYKYSEDTCSYTFTDNLMTYEEALEEAKKLTK